MQKIINNPYMSDTGRLLSPRRVSSYNSSISSLRVEGAGFMTGAAMGGRGGEVTGLGGQAAKNARNCC